MTAAHEKREGWVVYMVAGADGKFYTGVTNNIKRRLDQHNGLLSGGARYTRKHRPYVLLHLEKVQSRSDALKREHAIRQLTHREKHVLSKLSNTKDLRKALLPKHP